jgi:hypothetical protein
VRIALYRRGLNIDGYYAWVFRDFPRRAGFRDVHNSPIVCKSVGNYRSRSKHHRRNRGWNISPLSITSDFVICPLSVCNGYVLYPVARTFTRSKSYAHTCRNELHSLFIGPRGNGSIFRQRLFVTHTSACLLCRLILDIVCSWLLVCETRMDVIWKIGTYVGFSSRENYDADSCCVVKPTNINWCTL